jgi:lipoprotein signal peptidase
MALVVVALVVLVPRAGSRALARAAGIACGGALGNLVSVIVFRRGVPDPIVVSHLAGGVAFNLADVFALVGDAAMLSAAAVYAIRRRGSLRLRV